MINLWFLKRFIVRRWLIEPGRIISLIAAVFLSIILFLSVYGAIEASVNSFSKGTETLKISDDIILNKFKGWTEDEIQILARHVDNTYSIIQVIQLPIKIICFKKEIASNLLLIDSNEVINPYFLTPSGFEISEIVECKDGAILSTEDKQIPVKLIKPKENVIKAGFKGFLADISMSSLFSSKDLNYQIILKPLYENTETKRDDILNKIERDIPNCTILKSSGDKKRSQYLLKAFKSNILVLFCITVVLAFLSILQAVKLSSLRIEKEVSILYRMGASSFWLFFFLIFEGILIGLISIFLAFTAGYPLVMNAGQAIIQTSATLYGTEASSFPSIIELPPLIIFTAIVLGVLLPVLGLYFSIKRIVVKISKKTERKQYLKYNTYYTFIGIFSLILAVLLIYQGIHFSRLIYVYLGTFVSFISLFTVTYVSTEFLIKLYPQSSTPTGLIALGEVQETHKKSMVSVGIFTTGVALLIGLGVLTECFEKSLNAWANRNFQADIFIRPAGLDRNINLVLQKGNIEFVKSHNNIDEIQLIYRTEIEIEGKFLGVEGNAINTIKNRALYRFIAGTYPVEKEILISESAASKTGFKLGDIIKIANREFKISGIYQDFTKDQGILLLNDFDYKNIFGEYGLQSLLVYLKDNSLNKISELQNELKKDQTIEVLRNDEIRKLIKDIFKETFAITEVIRFIVALLCSLTFLTNLWQFAYERIKNYRVLRFIGFSRSDFCKLFLKLSILESLGGVIIGVVGGIILSWLLVKVINPLSFGWNLYFILSYYSVFSPVILFFTLFILGSWVMSFRYIELLKVSDREDD